MKVNAEEFRRRPRDVYEAADKGETVTINHDRYRKVFELTARDREPLKETCLDFVLEAKEILDEQPIHTDNSEVWPDTDMAFVRNAVKKLEGKETFYFKDIRAAMYGSEESDE